MSTQTIPQGLDSPTSSTSIIQKLRRFVASREFWALFDQGVVSGTNFLTNIIVGNLCLPSDFGIFVMAMSLVHFVKGFQEYLVSAPYTVFWHRRDPEKAALFSGSAMAHQILISGLTVVGLVALYWSLSAHASSQKLAAAIGVLILVMPFFLLREYARKLLFAHFQFRRAVVIDIVLSISQLSLLGALAYLGQAAVQTVFLGITVACFLSVAVWFLFFRIPMKFEVATIRSDWFENWKFGRWAVMTHVVGCSIPYFMPWFITYLRTEAVTGKYGACQTLVGLANMLLVGVSNFLSPKSAHAYTHGGTKGLWRVLLQSVAIFVATLGPFCILLAATGDTFPHMFFGDEYVGLGKPLVYLAISVLAGGLGMVAGNGLWAMERPSLNFVADLTCLLSSFGLGFLWIPEHGASGAAAAVMTAAVATAVLRWLILLWLMRRQPAESTEGAAG